MQTQVDTAHYAYTVDWSSDDGEYVGRVLEFPSLSWLDSDQLAALVGVRNMVVEVVADMDAAGEPIPEPLGERDFSGKFNVRVRPEVHRALVQRAARDKVSLNRLVSDVLSRI